MSSTDIRSPGGRQCFPSSVNPPTACSWRGDMKRRERRAPGTRVPCSGRAESWTYSLDEVLGEPRARSSLSARLFDAARGQVVGFMLDCASCADTTREIPPRPIGVNQVLPVAVAVADLPVSRSGSVHGGTATATATATATGRWLTPMPPRPVLASLRGRHLGERFVTAWPSSRGGGEWLPARRPTASSSTPSATHGAPRRRARGPAAPELGPRDAAPE